MRSVTLCLMSFASACSSAWQPVPLIDGYQIMVMNSKEVYVANAENELVLGPTIQTIGIAPGIILVDCGLQERVVNGFSNTIGLNLIDTKKGTVTKRLTRLEAEAELRARNQHMPQMRDLGAYLK